jgi:hypothetical protein
MDPLSISSSHRKAWSALGDLAFTIVTFLPEVAMVAADFSFVCVHTRFSSSLRHTGKTKKVTSKLTSSPPVTSCL